MKPEPKPGGPSFAALSRKAGSSRRIFAVLTLLTASVYAQTTPAKVTFTFARPGLPVPTYALTVAEDGTGTYRGEELLQVRDSRTASPPQPFTRDFTLSAATAAKIFALTRDVHQFNQPCGTKAKNIADTGKKTLTYTASAVSGTCAYNYSDSKDIATLTEIFQGLAETMDEGRRIDFMHRFDRLGLDAELIIYTRQVSEGRALEVVTIAPSLQSLAADSELLQRVRQKANALLAQIPQPSPKP